MRTSLYRHFNDAGELLYVGVSLSAMEFGLACARIRDAAELARLEFVELSAAMDEDLTKSLEDAVAEERERCAKVAEAEDVAPTDDPLGVQQSIADSIRRKRA